MPPKCSGNRRRNPVETLGEGGDGNTSSSPPPKTRGSQLTNHFFTFNNYNNVEGGDPLQVYEKLKNHPKVLKFVFQEETGEGGTPHLQGNVICKPKQACRYTEFGLPKQVHWEKTRNTEKAMEYCQKEDSRTGKTYSWGFPKPLKIITDLYPWQKELLDLTQTEPDDRAVHWIFETVGCTGKTAFIKYMIHHHNALVCSSGKHADIINFIFNSDMDQSNVVFFTLSRSDKGKISYSALEAIKDGLISNTKYETGQKIFNPPHVIVLANYPPDKPENLSEDRWRIRDLTVGVRGISDD